MCTVDEQPLDRRGRATDTDSVVLATCGLPQRWCPSWTVRWRRRSGGLAIVLAHEENDAARQHDGGAAAVNSVAVAATLATNPTRLVKSQLAVSDVAGGTGVGAGWSEYPAEDRGARL